MVRAGYIAAPVTVRSRTVPAVLAVVILALLATGIRTAVTRHGDTATGLDADMAAVIAELEAFVESTRGLRFLEPVDVAVVGAAAFHNALSGGAPVDKSDAEVEAGLLRALGLVEAGVDVGAVDAFDEDTVAGFYDTEAKKLVVRGGRLTPFVRQVLVHELTHALDDQHFNLDPDLIDDEASLAFDALVEGDATFVENRYLESLPDPVRRQARAEEEAIFGGTGTSKVPEVFLDLGDFPYAQGPELIAALLAAGGRARLDEAFRSPPTTSAEVLHPDRFLAGRARARVPKVAADGRVVDDGVLGEFLLRLVLAESVPDGQADRAAEGWAGDGYVAWQTGKRTCVRSTVVMDSEAEAGELVTALRQWATSHPGATVVPSPSAVTFSRCA